MRATLVEGAVAIEVRDHGPGATPALLESMFDPFVKGPDEARGVGLGLAIARNLARGHGGDIALEPVEPHGARFVFCLPLV